MPAKKQKIKKTSPSAARTKTKKSLASSHIKQSIHEAVDSLPGLLVEEAQQRTAGVPTIDPVSLETRLSVTEKKPSKNRYEPALEAKKRFMLWGGVSLITAMIFFVWIWNARAMIQNVTQSHGTEATIINNAGQNLDTLFASIANTPLPTFPVTSKPTDDTAALTAALGNLFTHNATTTMMSTTANSDIQPSVKKSK